MGLPKVRLLLKDEEIQVRAFPEGGGALRIGRMKENDVVVNNLSVSRFHGVLSWEDGTFAIEDLGSENGIYLNGSRVEGTALLEPGDEIAIGKHRLSLEWNEGSLSAPQPAPVRGTSDPWDAANTYLVGDETRAKLLDAHEEPLRAAQEAELGSEEDSEEEPIDMADLEAVELDEGPTDEHQVEGLFESLGASESLSAENFDVSELPIELESEGRDEIGDVEGSATGESAFADLDDSFEAEPVPDTLLIDEDMPDLSDGIAAAQPLYPGLIVQRGGEFQRVLSWDADRLTVGRGGDCDVVLATPEVSRRHTMFVRKGDHFEVRDLESINGTLVNGNRVGRCTLEVGDTVKVEDFELTFVVESHPIGEEIVAQSVSAVSDRNASTADGGLTQLDENMLLAPSEPAAAAAPAAGGSPVRAEPLADVDVDLAMPTADAQNAFSLGDAEPDAFAVEPESPGGAAAPASIEPEAELLASLPEADLDSVPDAVPDLCEPEPAVAGFDLISPHGGPEADLAVAPVALAAAMPEADLDSAPDVAVDLVEPGPAVGDFELISPIGGEPEADLGAAPPELELAAAPVEVEAALVEADPASEALDFDLAAAAADLDLDPEAATAPDLSAALEEPDPAPEIAALDLADNLEVLAEEPDDDKDLEVGADQPPAQFELEVDVAALPESVREALRKAGELRVPVVLRVREP